ncbi:MAG: hypothetical protein GXP32_07825, partial [Kiritimatiellaeota bacterium]|nr:hypothetical protein [Kiritimatiellota bacterium]
MSSALLSCLPAFSEIAIDVLRSSRSTNDAGKGDSKKTDKGGGNGKKADVALFKNKDALHGRLLSFSPDKGLLWKSPESVSEIIFKPANLREIRFGVFAKLAKAAQDSILLTNGDEIFGTIVSLDTDKLVIDTPFAGRLTIEQHMLDTITPGSGSGTKLYVGPNSIDEWKVTNQGGGRGNAPTVSNGVMILRRYTSVSRDMRLPPVFKLSFKFENLGSSQFSIRFCASSPDINNRKNAYMLSVSRNYFYLQRSFNNSSRNLGNIRLRDLRADKGELTILCDAKKKTIILMVNGKVRKQWNDSQFLTGGKFVSFYNQSSGMLKIS